MKKIILGIGLTVLLVLAGFIGFTRFASASPVTIILNGTPLLIPEGEPSAFVSEEGRTMVPISFIAKGIGVSTDWIAERQQVHIHGNGRRLVLGIGIPAIGVDGRDVRLDTPSLIKRDRTFVPLRAITEGLGGTVNWNGETRTVYIDIEILTAEQLEAEAARVEAAKVEAARAEAATWQAREKKIVASKPAMTVTIDSGLNAERTREMPLESRLWELLNTEGSLNVVGKSPKVTEITPAELERLQAIHVIGRGIGAYRGFGQLGDDEAAWIRLVSHNIGMLPPFVTANASFISHPQLVWGDVQGHTVIRGIATLQYVSPENPFVQYGVQPDKTYQVDVEVVMWNVWVDDLRGSALQVRVVRYLSGFREVE